jgi:pimeloyl-ACP methyl ester carboxylesterase
VATLDPAELTVERPGLSLSGEAIGDGFPVVLLHGITATRRYVVHGSKALGRAGYRQITYDARGHGRSGPAPPGSGYAYSELVADLDALVDSVVTGGRLVLGGHSMGAHTAVAYAIERPERVAGLILIGPVYMGFVDEDALPRWDRLADGLERGGADGFLAALDHGLDPAWRETVLRISRERIAEHRHPEAVDLPALVVASHDVADPGHPYAVAAAYAERLPRSRLVSEGEGESPLAWQGGRLAREIAGFCTEDEVATRLAG